MTQQTTDMMADIVIRTEYYSGTNVAFAFRKCDSARSVGKSEFSHIEAAAVALHALGLDPGRQVEGVVTIDGSIWRQATARAGTVRPVPQE